MRGDEDKVFFSHSFLPSNGIDLLLHFLALSKPLVNMFRILLLIYSLVSACFLFQCSRVTVTVNHTWNKICFWYERKNTKQNKTAR